MTNLIWRKFESIYGYKYFILKKILLLICLITCSFQSVIAQNDTLYLYIEELKFCDSCEEPIGTGFAVASKDKNFLTDYYKFDVENLKGLSSNGYIEYYALTDLRKEVDINSINYIDAKDYIKGKKWWEIHDDLSSKSRVFLVLKIKGEFDSSTGTFDIKYYKLPVIYTGTRKNVWPKIIYSDKN